MSFIFHDIQFERAFKTITRVTFHEAGHAVVAHALGIEVPRVFTDLPRRIEGDTWQTGSGVAGIKHRVSSMDVLAQGHQIAFCVAGYLAERRAAPELRKKTLWGALVDLNEIEEMNPFSHLKSSDRFSPEWRALTRPFFANEAQWKRFCRAWIREAKHVLVANWEHVTRLARELRAARRTRRNGVVEGRTLHRLLKPVLDSVEDPCREISEEFREKAHAVSMSPRARRPYISQLTAPPKPAPIASKGHQAAQAKKKR
jgi:hypothetical protein